MKLNFEFLDLPQEMHHPAIKAWACLTNTASPLLSIS